MLFIASRLLKMPLALLLDDKLGEPSVYHPLTGFGRLARCSENFFHSGYEPGFRKALTNVLGALALVAVVAPPVALARLLVMAPFIGNVFEIFLLYLTIAPSSLTEHADDVYAAMSSGDLLQARILVSRIVSRDTAALGFRELSAATVESVLENGNDAVFAALFWYYIGGAPGALLYRLVNTLDAMWGYRNSRYQDFGWAAARLDDLLNWLPARLTALSYSLVGDSNQALTCWQQQGRQWYSPNAGPVMAAGAGALNLTVGGDAVYGGLSKHRPSLGCGDKAQARDIPRAVKLVRSSLQLWSILSTLGGLCLLVAGRRGVLNTFAKQGKLF